MGCEIEKLTSVSKTMSNLAYSGVDKGKDAETFWGLESTLKHQTIGANTRPRRASIVVFPL